MSFACSGWRVVSLVWHGRCSKWRGRVGNWQWCKWSSHSPASWYCSGSLWLAELSWHRRWELSWLPNFICLFTPISRKPHNRTSPNFCACCLFRGSDFLWRRLDTLCISGFMNDVILSYHWARIKHDVVYKSSAGGWRGGTSWTSHNYSIWLSSSECHTGGKVCYLQLPETCFQTKIVCIICLSFVFVHKNANTATNVINHILHQIFST